MTRMHPQRARPASASIRNLIVMLAAAWLLQLGVLTQAHGDEAMDDATLKFLESRRAACSVPSGRLRQGEDILDSLIVRRQRYRLVIGASDYRDEPLMNRAYVADTAKLVDEALASLGYQALPSRAQSTPYVVGSEATKKTITEAFQELESVTRKGDFAIVYYVGHGAVSPGGKDLSLSVYDRPISGDDGVRFGDMIGILSTTAGAPASGELSTARVVFMVDACYSGNAVTLPKVLVSNTAGVQQLVTQMGGVIIPPTIAVLTSTGKGDGPRAFAMGSGRYSAFGLLLARAIAEDWDCADGNFDGVVTAYEFKKYAHKWLKAAQEAGLVPGEMDPLLYGDDQEKPHFIAYNRDRYFNEGVREEFTLMSMKIPAGKAAFATVGSQPPIVCIKECSFLVLKKQAETNVKFATFSAKSYLKAQKEFTTKFGTQDYPWLKAGAGVDELEESTSLKVEKNGVITVDQAIQSGTFIGRSVGGVKLEKQF
jgi:hypothetical protein